MPNQAAASDLPFYDNLCPQKVPFLKNSDDVIACDLLFASIPPFKNPGYAMLDDSPKVSFAIMHFGFLIHETY